ncbi:polysaccharide lyase family 3 protein [Amniculicola lignicola CBS 123094]|uniref:Pectate lyase n=1 Tax=Amniculicola lignicola CBS 123094 TaxID=1392246 RepID=A0A6A5WSN5_9PLEO|nr:polysaccharide lyase family 3 protein [Amniculicola lignicola CBS 123094]
MKYSVIASILAIVAPITAAPADGGLQQFNEFQKRATFPIPASKGSVTYKAAKMVSGTFDGGMKTYGRGVKCGGQAEGGDKDAVFLVANGGTLQNVIIGKDQNEGVHCLGACTIKNVWWVDVCEDALTIKGDGNALVSGGGAQAASDKIIQHNGKGTVTIDGFTAMDFGKLYRSCGNCKVSNERHVVIKNVKAYNGKVLIGINPNFKDTAVVTGTCATSVKTLCEEFEGTTPGNEPKSVHKGASSTCKIGTIKAC